MRQVSITDIAREAGVSPSTVSRALQDHPRISAERRASIRALAARLGYRPSQVARSLVTGHTRTLGVVVTDVTDPFVAEVMQGAEASSRAAGYSLLFAASHRDPERELEAMRLLLDRQVDGMIVISGRAGSRYGELRAGGADDPTWPLVLVNNRQPGRDIFSVQMDNQRGAMLAVAYLGELGHRRIAFIAGPQQGRSSRERLEGYRAGIQAQRTNDSGELIIAGSGLLEDGPRALHALLDTPQPPTAVLCYNDLAAIGLVSAAHAAGIRVPQELSVIGYDNIPMSEYTIPPLTTVDQPKAQMGGRAVDVCVAALAGEPTANVVLEGRLVVRASTAAR